MTACPKVSVGASLFRLSSGASICLSYALLKGMGW